MMNFRLLLAAVLLLFPAAAYADHIGPSEPLTGGKVLRGRFTEEHHLPNVDEPLLASGHFVIAPGHGVIWAMEQPVPLTIVLTPAGMAQLIGTMPLMNVPASKKPFLASLPDKITAALSGDMSVLSNDFTVIPSGTAKHWLIKLVPIKVDKNLPFESITAKGAHYVDDATMIKGDGSQDHFAFTNQAISSQPLSASETAMFAAIRP